MSAAAGPAAERVLADPATVADALAEAERIGCRAAAELALARWFGRIEYGRGWRDGYDAAHAEMAADWAAAARPVAQGGPAHAELERRRWGSGGRSRFGDPRPGDYRGRQGAA